MPATKTAVGTVDTEVLNRLTEDFDTRKLMGGVNTLTSSRLQIDEIDDWQKRLSKLHQMAMYLINDNTDTVYLDQPIWELATELSDEISEWKGGIDDLYKALEELSMLAPEDYDDEDCEAG